MSRVLEAQLLPVLQWAHAEANALLTQANAYRELFCSLAHWSGLTMKLLADTDLPDHRWTLCSHFWATTQYFGIDCPSTGLTVQLVGFKGLMMTSRIDPTAALGVVAIAKSILVLRHQNILLDRDLAALYRVTTKRLNEQAKRNLARFPIDFMFQLTAEEEAVLRLHFATSIKPAATRGGRRYLPYAIHSVASEDGRCV
jgi:ORF6N domain